MCGNADWKKQFSSAGTRFLTNPFMKRRSQGNIHRDRRYQQPKRKTLSAYAEVVSSHLNITIITNHCPQAVK
jgi:hypothetical protein